VSLADGSVAIAAVADLMMAISRSQAALLDTLNRLSSRIRSEVEMARRVRDALLTAARAFRGGEHFDDYVTLVVAQQEA